MNEAQLFEIADRAFAGVVDQVTADRWEETTPAWLDTAHRGPHTLRQLVDYHAYDTAWVPDVLGGKTIAEVGTAHDGDLLDGDPGRRYRALSDLAVAAARRADLERTVHLSYGDWTAREYLQHTSNWRGLRVYELSLWLGLPTALPPDLVEGMWELLAPHYDEWRAFGIFPPAVAVADDAPLQDRLLGRAGRDPHAQVR